MFDAPLDAWYVWLGLIAASGAAFGVASAVPGSPPPDAASAAQTVDRIAVSQYDAVGEHPIPNAEAVRIGSDSISIRGAGGVAHASFGHGPITPADDGRLGRVLRGAPPERIYSSVEAFSESIADARSDDPTWHDADRLHVRAVSWGGVDVTLVG